MLWAAVNEASLTASRRAWGHAQDGTDCGMRKIAHV